LENINGKFLLSSFRNAALTDAIKRKGWHSPEFSTASPITHGAKTPRKKIDVLTARCPVSVKTDGRRKKELATESDAD
jgi:DNA adenine methylase